MHRIGRTGGQYSRPIPGRPTIDLALRADALDAGGGDVGGAPDAAAGGAEVAAVWRVGPVALGIGRV
ncbi:MAG: hypothetical protein EB039_09915, partial [Proteobacteria bacterium]|nr:hypothetical protein [Pseudomonadota bacterium]